MDETYITAVDRSPFTVNGQRSCSRHKSVGWSTAFSHTSDITRWDEIAWNGIAFQKPSCWEIATIGRNYLMLGTQTGPRMEINWGKPSKAASHHHRLNQFKAAKRYFGRRKHGLSADVWNPPQSWLDALPTHEVGGFSWKNPAGNALIISCSSCNRTSLFQFYQSSSEDHAHFHTIVSKLLSTFRDHSENNLQRWTVFDIRATLPAAFQIKSYQFSSGFMEMVFFTNGLRISLYRWSPASVLLAGRKLSEFAGLLPFYPEPSLLEAGLLQSETIGDANRMEWEKTPSLSLLNRLAAFLSVGFSHQRFLIRHIAETNRILAVRSESRQSVDSNLFDQIVADYETSAA